MHTRPIYIHTYYSTLLLTCLCVSFFLYKFNPLFVHKHRITKQNRKEKRRTKYCSLICLLIKIDHESTYVQQISQNIIFSWILIKLQLESHVKVYPQMIVNFNSKLNKKKHAKNNSKSTNEKEKIKLCKVCWAYDDVADKKIINLFSSFYFWPYNFTWNCVNKIGFSL